MKQIDITKAVEKRIKSVVIGYDNQIAITFYDGTFSYMEIEKYGCDGEINRMANFHAPYFGERAPLTGIISQEEYDAQLAVEKQARIDSDRKQYERLRKIFESK